MQRGSHTALLNQAHDGSAARTVADEYHLSRIRESRMIQLRKMARLRVCAKNTYWI